MADGGVTFHGRVDIEDMAEAFLVALRPAPGGRPRAVVGGRWALRRQAARYLRHLPEGARELWGRATPEHLEVRTGLTMNRKRWAAYSHHRMDDRFVVLFQSRVMAQMVARGYFASDEAWDRFRSIVASSVPAETPPGTPAVVVDPAPVDLPSVTGAADPSAVGPKPGVAFQGRHDDGQLAGGIRFVLRRRARRRMLRVLPVAAAVVAAQAYIAATGGGLSGVLLVALAVIAAALVVSTVVSRWVARQGLAGPGARSWMAGLASDDGVEVRTWLGDSFTCWPVYSRHQADDRFVALFSGNTAAVLVSRGFFASDTDWSDFAALVREKVPVT